MEKFKDLAQFIREVIINSEEDCVWLSSGDEGSGKSDFGVWFCSQVDPNFSVNNIVFTLSSFKDAILTLPPGSAILVDESGDLLLSREAMSSHRIQIIKDLMKARCMQKFIFLNISWLRGMETYIKSFRARAISRTRTETDLKENKVLRGLVHFYTKTDIPKITIDTQGNIKWGRPTLVDTFPDMRDVNPELWKAYKAKKDEYLLKTGKQKKREFPVSDIVEQFPGIKKSALIKKVVRKLKCSEPTAYKKIKDEEEIGYIKIKPDKSVEFKRKARESP